MKQNPALDRGKSALRAAVRRRVVPILAARWFPLFLALVAILISLPALSTGLLTDDYVHRAMLTADPNVAQQLAQVGLAFEGAGRLGPALSDLFVVVDPDENLARYRAYGALPWWTCDDYRVAHWRPVASLTHWLDYRLIPNTIWLMHLHSILWFAAVVLIVAILYRRFIGAGWVAGLAGVLYLISDDAYFPTMWLANRNLLISLFFGIVTLIVHDRWRRDHWKPGAVVAPLCLLVSVLAAEGGVATFAYLFAYEVVLGPGRPLRRAGALVPFVAVIVSWRLLYNFQGYGAAGGGFYLDPVQQPLAYLVAVFQRVPFLLAGLWTTSPPELHSLLPSDARMLLCGVLAVLAVLIPLGLRPLFRRNRRMWFWLIGMHAAALPVCATIPMSRGLLFVAIGGFGLLAECFGAWFEGADRQRRPARSGWILRLLVIALLLTHLPLAVAIRAGAFKVTGKVTKWLNRATVIGLFSRVPPDQDLVIVNAPNPAALVHDPFRAVCEGKSLPAGLRVLAPGFGRLEIARTGPRRLVIRSLADSLLDCQQGYRIDPVFFFHRLSDVRGPGHPMKAGQRMALPRMAVDVLAVDERGSPLEVAFTFEAALEDPALLWLYWDWGHRHFVVFSLPPVGQSVCLRGPF
jgi:hypothetical protein